MESEFCPDLASSPAVCHGSESQIEGVPESSQVLWSVASLEVERKTSAKFECVLNFISRKSADYPNFL